MGDFDGDIDIVAEIDKILSAPQGGEGVEPEATEAPQIESPEIQPETEEQDDAPAVEAAEGEEAEAPAIEDQATQAVAQPKAPSVSSPELEQKMGEAARTAQEAQAARDQYTQALNALNTLVPQLQAQVMGEFADIKTQDDLFALAEQDPARYNRLLIAGHRLTLAQREQARVQQENTNHIVRAELDKVSKKLPDYTDPVKGPVLREKLMAFAKTEGIEVENRPFVASDVLTLHKYMTAQEKVAAYEAEKAKQQTQITEAAKKASKAPPVQKPGVQRQTDKSDKATTDFVRFQKSGRQDDLASFLQNIL